MSDWTSEYAQMLEDCEEREERLNDWQRAFIDSLGCQMAQGRAPTPKQVDALNEIWERATARG